MLNAKARWSISEAQEEAAARMAEALNLHPLIAKLLTVRGICGVEEAERFLFAGADRFYNPFLLKGMEDAVARIRAALERKEKIRIYGDYDADGISSTTLMIRLLKRLGADFDAYIPHRVQEGYGLNREALQQAKDSGAALIVTVDNGISARDEIAYAKELGLDVIVTDHHEPPELLPEAAAVVNPKQPGCTYPYKELAGVGVAFKLAHALLGEPPLEWLDMAAIGTVADLMPLTDENRLIVKLGLQRLRGTASPGLKALMDVSGIDRNTLTETHIGYALAPRINASGRLTHADRAVKLLTTEDGQEAEVLALELDMLNKERQKIVEEITRAARSQLEESGYGQSDQRIIVVAGEGWNVGVVGIVASKLLEQYYRPALVLAVDPETGTAKGSARSIPGFDIHRALTACSDLLDHFGGHQAAAGLTLPRERLPELQDRLEKLAREWLAEEDLIPILQADMACSLADTPLSCIDQLSQLAPFGSGNPSPRFLFEGLRISEKKTMGKEHQHLKLLLAAAEAETACTMEAVGFGYGEAADRIASTSSVDVVGELSVNEWNGTRRPQIMIQDMRIPKPQVFDWRGTRPGSSARGPALPAGSGIVIFDAKLKELVPGLWLDQGCPLWLAGGDTSDPQPFNAEAEKVPFAELADLVLYSLPPYEEWLHEALARLRGAQRLYAVFADAHDGSGGTLPDREGFKSVYALLGREKRIPAGDERIWTAWAKRTGLSVSSVQFILQVFDELGFVRFGNGCYQWVEAPAKRELADSEAYRRRMNRVRMEQLLIYSTASELTETLLAAMANNR